MAKFIYRMQNIFLDIKLKLESQAKIAYSQANAALREEEAKLFKTLLSGRMHMITGQKELVEGKIDLLEIKNADRQLKA